MKNKTATACWTILRSELDSAIDRYVAYEKARETVRGNICQKRLSESLGRNKLKLCGGFINIRERIKITKFTNQALINEEKNEVRKSKRNFEHKLAQNIKSDSKSFYMPGLEIHFFWW